VFPALYVAGSQIYFVFYRTFYWMNYSLSPHNMESKKYPRSSCQSGKPHTELKSVSVKETWL